MTNEIKFKNVSKSYSISRYRYRRLSEDLSQILPRLLAGKKRTIQKEKFMALKKVSFEIKDKNSFGIIGKNGAGKSTILKLISKITYPDEGNIFTNGRIGPFIELGAGLHPELSGRENIFLYGTILGMPRKEINEKFNDIVKFAELEKFLDTPIKRYSSGMYARLGFSVVAFMDPDILLVDEVLAVGDKSFQEKCMLKMNDFVKRGKIIVFVSHNLNAVKDLCKQVLLLDNGRVKKIGKAKEVIDQYLVSFERKN